MKGPAAEKASAKKDERTLVTVCIGGEMYGIDVGRVIEVMGVSEGVKVPNAMPFMKGLINLRGIMIPQIDMRSKFGIEEKPNDKNTVVVILEIKNKMIGIIVDSVSDVVSVPVEKIQNTPHFSSNVHVDCIDGVSEIGDKITIIMNVDRIFREEELENL